MEVDKVSKGFDYFPSEIARGIKVDMRNELPMFVVWIAKSRNWECRRCVLLFSLSRWRRNRKKKIRGRPAAAGRINGCSHERPKNLAPVSKLAPSTCLENVDDLFSLLRFSSFLFYHLLMLRQRVTSLGSINSRGLIYHWFNIFINTSVLLVKTRKTISIRTFSFVIDKVITKNMRIW